MTAAFRNESSDRTCHRESGFSGLPGEIRNNIYHYVVDNLPTPYTTSPKSLRKTSNLAQASKLVRKEYNSFVARHATHRISSISSLWALDSIIYSGQSADDTRRLITSVHFSKYCEMASSPSRAFETMDLCRSLPNLKALRLDLSLDYLQMPYIFYHSVNDSDESDEDEAQVDHTNSVTTLATLDATSKVIENYALTQILHLPRLKALTLTCKPGEGGSDPVAVAAFRNLRPWFEFAFHSSPTGDIRAVRCKKESYNERSIAFTLEIRRG